MASKPSEHSHIEGQLSFLDAASPAAEPEVTTEVAEQEPAVVAETVVEAVIPVELDQAVEDAVDPQEDPMILTGPNTRIRAGNAMQRARAGAIRGALETLARRGLKRLTMAEAADRGGLARATLYNHVRDKEALVALLLEHESQAVADAFIAAGSLEQALIDAATMVAEHPALVGLREHDPAALLRLTAPETGAVRELAAHSLAARGSAATDANVDLVLRWLASFVASPSDAQARTAQAAALARTLG